VEQARAAAAWAAWAAPLPAASVHSAPVPHLVVIQISRALAYLVLAPVARGLPDQSLLAPTSLLLARVGAALTLASTACLEQLQVPAMEYRALAQERPRQAAQRKAVREAAPSAANVLDTTLIRSRRRLRLRSWTVDPRSRRKNGPARIQRRWRGEGSSGEGARSRPPRKRRADLRRALLVEEHPDAQSLAAVISMVGEATKVLSTTAPEALPAAR